MNILFTTTTLPRFKGDGQSPFVLEQAAAWKAQRPGDNVYILAPHDPAAQSDEVIEGVVVHRYHYFFPYFLEKLCYPALLTNLLKNPLLFIELPFLFFSQFLTLLMFVRQKHIDLVYAHWVIPQAVIAYLVSRVVKVKYVIHNHSSDARVLLKIPFFGKHILRLIIEHAEKFFVTNTSLYTEARSIFQNKKSRDMDKIEVMPMGVSANLKLKIEHLKLKYDFGFIGRLTKKKGVHYFLKAVSEMKFPVRVGIAGQGEELESLEFQIKNLKLEDRVDVLGHVEGQEKWDFMQNCKVMVFPSVEVRGDVEGMPVSVLEALVLGHIVVASPATNIELLPEWDKLKQYVYISDAPQNSTVYATILERVVRLGASKQRHIQKEVPKIMKHYRWNALIKAYIQKLV